MPDRKSMLIIITMTVSFCSICYELLLAQSLSLFLRNTVLRYSVTIGLYLFAMGLGARSVEGKTLRYPRAELLKTEVLLTFIGGFLLLWLYGLDRVLGPGLIFASCAHLLILIVGYLTGKELPLLMSLMKEEDGQAESRVLGFSYFGAVIGTFVFAFVYYPVTGLIMAAFLTGLFNSCAGLLTNYLDTDPDKEEARVFLPLLAVQVALFVAMAVCLIFTPALREFCLNLYLREGA